MSTIIDSINGIYSAQTAAAGSSGSTQFKSADFMQMLLAQLEHQNPLEPMDDTAMMTQFTQLNSLQALQQIQSAMEKISEDSQMTYAASLMGKMVSISKSDGKSTEGKVTGFSMESGNAYIQVDEQSYPLDEVTKVWEEASNG